MSSFSGEHYILINNAGIMLKTTMLSEQSAESMRREMNVNVFGTLAMIQAFAPILAKNGGGAIANMLSVVSWFTYPFNATYCASKHAALAVTDAARIQLKAQGTQVLAVYAGFIDTDMASELARADESKTPPARLLSKRYRESERASTTCARTSDPKKPGILFARILRA
ncbi:MAG: SDR family NAD(P)-dependent oxidoreductase [Candidatus Acidiferrum sp.]